MAGLGVIADSVTYGYTASAITGSHGPRFLRITDIQDGRVDWNSVPTCTIEEMDIRKYGLVPGDIVFARTGATTGKSFLIRSCPLAVFASYLIRLRLLPEINPALLDYYFQTPDYWTFISDNVAGVAQPNCNATKLSELQIPIPPSGEQQRLVEAIATLLSKVGAARDHLSRVTAILKRFRQAVLAGACSGTLTEDWRRTNQDEQGGKDCLATSLERRKKLWQEREAERPGRRTSSNKVQRRTRQYDSPFEPDLAIFRDELPSTWVPATISQLAFLDVGFAFPSAEFMDSGIRLLRGENVEPGSLRWLDVKCWPLDKVTGFEHLIVQDGESILAMDRPVVSSGLKLARATANDIPCLLVQRVMRFKVPFPQVTDFLHLRLQTSDFLTHVSGGLTGSDLPHITGTNVAEYTFGLPPLAEQQEICRRVNGLMAGADAIAKRVERASAKAEQLTQSILAKAFRGELVPTEAELARREGRDYEPTSMLLERIKAEKASLDSEKALRSKRAAPRGVKRHSVSV